MAKKDIIRHVSWFLIVSRSRMSIRDQVAYFRMWLYLLRSRAYHYGLFGRVATGFEEGWCNLGHYGKIIKFVHFIWWWLLMFWRVLDLVRKVCLSYKGNVNSSLSSWCTVWSWVLDVLVDLLIVHWRNETYSCGLCTRVDSVESINYIVAVFMARSWKELMLHRWNTSYEKIWGGTISYEVAMKILTFYPIRCMYMMWVWIAWERWHDCHEVEYAFGMMIEDVLRLVQYGIMRNSVE